MTCDGTGGRYYNCMELYIQSDREKSTSIYKVDGVCVCLWTVYETMYM